MKAAMGDLAKVIARAISPSSVRPDGALTVPRSFGVYRIPSSAASTRRYRYGNHPIRLQELEREFGSCRLEHLFAHREEAKKVALALAAGENI
jgi:hypothetical protein